VFDLGELLAQKSKLAVCLKVLISKEKDFIFENCALQNCLLARSYCEKVDVATVFCKF